MTTSILRFLICVAAFLAASCANAATSIAAARTADGYAYYWCTDKATVAEAKGCALASCHSNAGKDGSSTDKCKTLASDPHKGWWAIYQKSDGGLSYAFAGDRQEAIDDAYAQCTKNGGQCPDAAADVFSDGQLGDSTRQAPHAERWTTSCENADCVRT
jgi:hypothetical protein